MSALRSENTLNRNSSATNCLRIQLIKQNTKKQCTVKLRITQVKGISKTKEGKVSGL